eukprot:CAMPEP_0182457522 /NCGR_PEP_ID=MMETSP1319-20130603/3081_1 /TAXON_ID=172717 /ORGANISM="Bolidomonas pacifica, Strain RCC208" /LENGTH=109 /DNA_ID=CAMNT_0024656013 /DNA_START=386 /DNA_END=715 /DNA_ORIENTATION=-
MSPSLPLPSFLLLLLLLTVSLCPSTSFAPVFMAKVKLVSSTGKSTLATPGSKLSQACSKLGIKPKYSCKKGDCGSCAVSVGGKRIKACVGKVPEAPRLKSLQEKGLEVK